MEYIIETENLVKQYGAAAAVDDINIHVPKGSIYGLLGRNGAGKTTAMKMMLNLVFPTSGKIQLFGEDCKENTERVYSKIGSIVETPGFYENLTAYENLEILRHLRKKPKKECVKEALEVVGLQNEHTKPYSDYSLGMKQRLGIAAAIMHKPKLLILDEPINGLDPIGISEIRLLLSKLSKEYGTTIFISSHVLNEIEQIADIIGVMHEGKLLEEVNIERLHQNSRRYLEFKVSDTSAAVKLLENHYQITDSSILEDTLRVYDHVQNSGEINKLFNDSGLLVTAINVYEEKLEDYFAGLIGGGGIA